MNLARPGFLLLSAVLEAACGRKAGSSASMVDGAGLSPSSCAPGGDGMTHCSPSRDSCCISLSVPGGTFARGYDAVTYLTSSNPATVSAFRLDKYEITVGRFRQFVKAVASGYAPAAGSGKHRHLTGGGGLNGGTESGWDSAWSANLATTLDGWNANLACDRAATWTALPSKHENRPINCIEWYDAYAFCIWDGGFLPSEAEWNYAASGGSEQRVYPWSRPAESTAVDCTRANFNSADIGCHVSETSDVGSASGASALWGQTDMAGNLWEWTLDVYDAGYVNPCRDCMNLQGGNRVIRGGSFRGNASGPPTYLLTSFRSSDTATDRFSGAIGARCARAP